jgi:hypothetical protein
VLRRHYSLGFDLTTGRDQPAGTQGRPG